MSLRKSIPPSSENTGLSRHRAIEAVTIEINTFCMANVYAAGQLEVNCSFSFNPKQRSRCEESSNPALEESGLILWRYDLGNDPVNHIPVYVSEAEISSCIPVG